LERNLSTTALGLTEKVIQATAEWQLCQPIILTILGKCNIDLFASYLKAQLNQFVSWRPDPDAVEINTLQFPWSRQEDYAFPPFCPIGRRVKKVRE